MNIYKHMSEYHKHIQILYFYIYICTHITPKYTHIYYLGTGVNKRV